MIKPGDTVAYSKDFLQSTGQLTGDTPQARGKVLELRTVGGLTLAIIDWGVWEMPKKVGIGCLVKVSKERGVEDRA